MVTPLRVCSVALQGLRGIAVVLVFCFQCRKYSCFSFDLPAFFQPVFLARKMAMDRDIGVVIVSFQLKLVFLVF